MPKRYKPQEKHISEEEKQKLKQKYLKLLLTLPDKYFGKYWIFIHNIRKDLENGKNIPDILIAFCYYGLCLSLLSGNIKHKMPNIKEKTNWQDGDYYEYFDTINPDMNFFYTRVYKKDFLLPKVYKNVFYNTAPQTRLVLIKPKESSNFKEVKKLRGDFISKARYPLILNYDIEEYLREAEKYVAVPKLLKEDYLENCHKTLRRFLSKAELTYNKQPIVKGSVILAQELNNLLANQNIIDNKHFEKRVMTPYRGEEILADVREHKKAMFYSELKHDYNNFRRIQELWQSKKVR